MFSEERLLKLTELCKVYSEERRQSGFRWPKEVRREVLSLSNDGVGVGEISKACGLRDSTVHRWVRTKKPKDSFKEIMITKEKPSELTVVICGQREVRILGLNIKEALSIIGEIS
jgi:hypothetical protein